MEDLRDIKRMQVKELEKFRLAKNHLSGWLYYTCKEKGLDQVLDDLIVEGLLVERCSLENRKILTIELIPSTSHYKNVRSEVPKDKWNTIRKKVYKQARECCEVCGGIGKEKHRIECHEIWGYDDELAIQKLIGLIGLCPDCHLVKHMGLAQIKGKEAEAKKHLAYVNDWTDEFVKKYVSEQFFVHHQRSTEQWTIDITYLDSMVTNIIELQNGTKYKIVKKLN